MSKVEFAGYQCDITFGYYGNTRIAIKLVDPMAGPIVTATINLPDEDLEGGYVMIKDYRENAGIKKALIKAGIIGYTYRKIPVGGFGEEYVDVCKLIQGGEGG